MIPFIIFSFLFCWKCKCEEDLSSGSWDCCSVSNHEGCITCCCEERLNFVVSSMGGNDCTNVRMCRIQYLLDYLEEIIPSLTVPTALNIFFEKGRYEWTRPIALNASLGVSVTLQALDYDAEEDFDDFYDNIQIHVHESLFEVYPAVGTLLDGSVREVVLFFVGVYIYSSSKSALMLQSPDYDTNNLAAQRTHLWIWTQHTSFIQVNGEDGLFVPRSSVWEYFHCLLIDSVVGDSSGFVMKTRLDSNFVLINSVFTENVKGPALDLRINSDSTVDIFGTYFLNNLQDITVRISENEDLCDRVGSGGTDSDFFHCDILNIFPGANVFIYESRFENTRSTALNFEVLKDFSAGFELSAALAPNVDFPDIMANVEVNLNEFINCAATASVDYYVSPFKTWADRVVSYEDRPSFNFGFYENNITESGDLEFRVRFNNLHSDSSSLFRMIDIEVRDNIFKKSKGFVLDVLNTGKYDYGREMPNVNLNYTNNVNTGGLSGGLAVKQAGEGEFPIFANIYRSKFLTARNSRALSIATNDVSSSSDTLPTFEISQCEFTGNSAGALKVLSSGGVSVRITDTTFFRNSATFGGAVYFQGDFTSSTLFFVDDTVKMRNNSASLYGGAIITNTLWNDNYFGVVEDNFAAVAGGGLYLVDLFTTENLCCMLGNRAPDGEQIMTDVYTLRTLVDDVEHLPVNRCNLTSAEKNVFECQVFDIMFQDYFRNDFKQIPFIPIVCDVSVVLDPKKSTIDIFGVPTFPIKFEFELSAQSIKRVGCGVKTLNVKFGGYSTSTQITFPDCPKISGEIEDGIGKKWENINPAVFIVPIACVLFILIICILLAIALVLCCFVLFEERIRKDKSHHHGHHKHHKHGEDDDESDDDRVKRGTRDTIMHFEVAELDEIHFGKESISLFETVEVIMRSIVAVKKVPYKEFSGIRFELRELDKEEEGEDAEEYRTFLHFVDADLASEFEERLMYAVEQLLEEDEVDSETEEIEKLMHGGGAKEDEETSSGGSEEEGEENEGEDDADSNKETTIEDEEGGKGEAEEDEVEGEDDVVEEEDEDADDGDVELEEIGDSRI